MSVVNVTLGDGKKLNLPLGRQGENEVTAVVFDFSAWSTEFGSGTLSLSVQRHGDELPYAVTMTTSGTNATWTISELDTAYKGTGEAQVKYTVGTKVKKSAVYKFTVNKSLGQNGEYPSPGQTWQEEIEDELADVKADLEELEGGGLTEDTKQALLQLAQKVAYIDDDGQTYYQDLYDALYPPAPPATLTSITCVYTQSGTVYTTDTLDSLKSDLVVTAHYSNGTTETVTTYTLSGTLAAGTSTITVSYGGKTTTFNVTVTHELTYVQDGLVMWLDGEKNSTGGTHATSLSTWVDQSGNGWDWNNDGNATINSKSVGFNGSSTTFSRASIPQNVQMIEVVLNNVSNGCVMTGFGRNYIGNVNIRSSDSLIAFHTATGSGENTNTGFIFGTGLHSANSGGYLDGEPATLISTGADWQGTTPRLGVYRYNTSNSYYFSGEIYCIRLYSRILTEEEILFNFATDQERFGIGVGS